MAGMDTKANLESRLRTLTIASWVLYIFVVAVSAWNFLPVLRSVLLHRDSPIEITHVALRNFLFVVTGVVWLSLEFLRKKTKAQLKAASTDN